MLFFFGLVSSIVGKLSSVWFLVIIQFPLPPCSVLPAQPAGTAWSLVTASTTSMALFSANTTGQGRLCSAGIPPPCRPTAWCPTRRWEGGRRTWNESMRLCGGEVSPVIESWIWHEQDDPAASEQVSLLGVTGNGGLCFQYKGRANFNWIQLQGWKCDGCRVAANGLRVLKTQKNHLWDMWKNL